MNQLVLILFIILGILFLIGEGLSLYISLKLNNKITILNNEIIKIKNNQSNDNIFDLDESMDFKKCIDELIEDEIMNTLKNNIVANEKYDMLKIDIDAKKIANDVYSSIKKDYLTDKELIFEPEFYQSYIIKRTITRLLLLAKDYNMK